MVRLLLRAEGSEGSCGKGFNPTMVRLLLCT